MTKLPSPCISSLYFPSGDAVVTAHVSLQVPSVGDGGGGGGGGVAMTLALVITGVTNFTLVFRLFKVDVALALALVGVANSTFSATASVGGTTMVGSGSILT